MIQEMIFLDKKKEKLIEQKTRIGSLIFQLIAIALGATMASIALGGIIIPNHMLDGGVTGIAIILNNLLPSISLTIWIALLNLPFVIFAYVKLSKKKAFLSIFGIALFSIGSGVTHHMTPIIENDKLLALIFGGMLMGAAIGIVIRFGGAVLDGAEIVSVYVDKVTKYNTDTVLLSINIVIFSTSSLVFGLESALYSITMFYVAALIIGKVTNINMMGHETVEMRINTTQIDKINHYIYEVGYQSEIQKVIGGYHYEQRKKGKDFQERLIISTNVARSDLENMSKNIKELDKGAYITFKKITELKSLESKNNQH